MALCENIVPNLYYLVIIFLYFLRVVYKNLFFTQQVPTKDTTHLLVKKSKYFNDNFFMYKNMLYFKYFSTPESQAQLQKSKQRLKRLIKLKKRKNNFFNLKPNVYFFENKFTLVSKQQNHISTSIALEDFNKFKNFNKDVYIKDEFITQNNNLSKQQR
jgi:hypothetical protein